MIESIDSTYIIIKGVSTEDNSLGDDVLLSFQDGTLLSYSEDLAGEGQSQKYNINLELLDPEGLFITKMYSFYLEQYKSFFESLSLNYDVPARIKELGPEEYRDFLLDYVKNKATLVQKAFVDPEKRAMVEKALKDRTGRSISKQNDIKPLPFDELDVQVYTGENAVQAVVTSDIFDLENIIKDSDALKKEFNPNLTPDEENVRREYDKEIERQNRANLSKAKKNFKRAIDSLDFAGLNGWVYVNIGVGDKYASVEKRNETGYRKFKIESLRINQDSGKDHIVGITLVPGGPDQIVLNVHETPSEIATQRYFPANDSVADQILLLKGTYPNNPQAVTLDEEAFSSAQIEVNNIPYIVSLMERLLQQYLNDSEIIPIVYISPAIEAAIKNKIDPDRPNKGSAKLIAPLCKLLRDVGFDVVCKLIAKRGNIEGGTIIAAPTIGGVTAQSSVSNASDEFRVRTDYDFEYYLKFVPDQNKNKVDDVLDRIRDLYKKLNVLPKGVSKLDLNITDHKKIFIKKQFEREGDLLVNKYFVEKKSELVEGPQQTQVATPFGVIPSYDESQTAVGTILNVKETSLISLTKEDVDSGNIPNIVLIGDDFLIRSLVVPFSTTFAEEAFTEYRKRVKLKLADIVGGPPITYSNAYKFLYNPYVGDPGGYLKYLEEYSKRVAKYVSYEAVEGTLAPDEYSLALDDAERSILSLLKGRVFIAGEQNSNVISVTSQEDALAFGKFREFFSLTFAPGIKSAERAVTKKVFINDLLPEQRKTGSVGLSEDEVEAIVGEAMKSVNSNIATEELIERVSETDPVEDIANFKKQMIRSFLTSPDVKSKKVSRTAFASYLAFLQKVSDEARTIIIKIKPDFRISSLQCLGSPALFYHSNPFITASRSNLGALSLLSGLYQIIGYKHVINSSEAYTQLVLLREPFSDVVDFTATSIAE